MKFVICGNLEGGPHAAEAMTIEKMGGGCKKYDLLLVAFHKVLHKWEDLGLEPARLSRDGRGSCFDKGGTVCSLNSKLRFWSIEMPILRTAALKAVALKGSLGRRRGWGSEPRQDFPASACRPGGSKDQIKGVVSEREKNHPQNYGAKKGGVL